ncbi:NSP-interacting kinase 1-like protein, partial [Tanacetum coccineum]
MDLLSNLNKAYYIVQQVEKHKHVTHHTSDPTAFFAKWNQSMRKDSINDGKNDNKGYLDWYKGKKNKKGKMVAQVATDFSPYMPKETPFDFEYENNVQTESTDLDQRMVAAVIFVSKNLQLDLRVEWIVDTWASDHIAPHLHLFHYIRVLKRPIKIRLPNETSKWVEKVGHIRINSSLALHNVFYVPDFKVPLTKKVLTVGQGFNNLYICKHSSDTPIKVPSIPVLSSFVNKEAHLYNVTLDLFHARLGHTSVSKLIHVLDCNERKHRHLLDTTRALKFHFGLPNKFWGDCVLTTTYLINKMPMEILDWKTPFEMLHGKVPSYEQLRVMGCLCFATITKPHKDKFTSRSIISVLIGYSPSQKGYKLYNLETHEVFCSRDVVFHETVFPFKQGSPVNTSSPAAQWPNEIGSQDDDPLPCPVSNPIPEPVVPNTPENE